MIVHPMRWRRARLAAATALGVTATRAAAIAAEYPPGNDYLSAKRN